MTCMEIRLLAFAIFLIAVGEVTGYGILSIFGFFLLFPALLMPPRRPPQQKVQQKVEQKVQPKRVEPPTLPAQPAAAPATVPMAKPEMPRPSQPSYSPALFPTAMFPSISPTPVASTATIKLGETAAAKPRDEVIEYGVLYAFLRLLAG